MSNTHTLHLHFHIKNKEVLSLTLKISIKVTVFENQIAEAHNGHHTKNSHHIAQSDFR